LRRLDPKVIFDGDCNMELAKHVRIASTKADVPSRDMTIILGYAVLSLVMLIAIYFSAGGPGTAPGDFAAMTVFP
jgi:hypothetical protein